MKKETIILYGGFLLVSAASMFISKTGQHIASGLLLLLAAVFLYVYFYRKTKSLVNFKGLLSLSFVGGEGIAAFQLSNLQTDWSIMTWVCFAAFYLSFLAGYDGKEWQYRKKDKMGNGRRTDEAADTKVGKAGAEKRKA